MDGRYRVGWPPVRTIRETAAFPGLKSPHFTRQRFQVHVLVYEVVAADHVIFTYSPKLLLLDVGNTQIQSLGSQRWPQTVEKSGKPSWHRAMKARGITSKFPTPSDRATKGCSLAFNPYAAIEIAISTTALMQINALRAIRSFQLSASFVP